MTNLLDVLTHIETRQAQAKLDNPLVKKYLDRLDSFYGTSDTLESLQARKDLIAIEYTQAEQEIINNVMLENGLGLAF